ncbi:MAG: 3-oxoacyl-[acyl-carrier-protein] reductase [Candidatus Omnitrophota bacterium]
MLKDKVALVTGSGRGIGKEIAAAFAKEGAKIVICDIDEVTASATAEEIASLGVETTSFKVDVTDLASIEEMVNKILDKFKRIDILINNAGITKDNILLRMKETDWDAVLNVNLKGTFNCTKVVSKVMLRQREGKIINIASIIGIMGNPGQANYAASKAGIIGFTKSVAKELASRNVNVNAVAPGYIQTEMTEKLPSEVKQKLLSLIPIKKMGAPRDVAGACLFLASPDSNYITGQTIVVDGGLAM